MSARVFLDTNVLLYVYSATEPVKRELAQRLVTESSVVISTRLFTLPGLLYLNFKALFLSIRRLQRDLLFSEKSRQKTSEF